MQIKFINQSNLKSEKNFFYVIIYQVFLGTLRKVLQTYLQIENTQILKIG